MQCVWATLSVVYPLYKVFPHYFINGTIFWGVGGVTEHKMCISNFSAHLSEIFFILRRNKGSWSKIYIGLHVKYPLFLSDFNETWTFSTDFEKSSNTKFHENPPSGSRVVPCGRMEWRTDMTNLVVAFRNFAKAPITLFNTRNVMETRLTELY
jgi:hypothetical protein